MNIKIIVLIIVVLILAGGFYVYNEYNRPASLGSVEFSMEAPQLLSEFEQDEAMANKKYLGKVIEVKGTIKDIIHQENVYTVLLGDKEAMNSVSCALGNEGAEEVAGIKPGDIASIKGTCTGILLDVALVNCEIVNN
jgi:hypothetical protein